MGHLAHVVSLLLPSSSKSVAELAPPVAFAQPFNEQRVKDLGEGDSMVLRELTVPVLGRALQRLLSSSYVHEAAARVRVEMPCSGCTAEGVILAVVSATPAAADSSTTGSLWGRSFSGAWCAHRGRGEPRCLQLVCCSDVDRLWYPRRSRS